MNSNNDRHLPRYTGDVVRAALGRPWPIVPARSFREVDEETGEVRISKKPNEKWKHLQGVEADDQYILHDATLWAFVTGPGSGIVILDADTDEALYGLAPHIATGRGIGGHIYVRHPGWKVKTRSNVLPGLDVRGDGGLAYFYGASLKGPYTLLREPVPYDVADLPENVARAAGLLEPPSEKPSVERGEWTGDGPGIPEAVAYIEQRCAAIDEAPDGSWNETFHKAVYGAAGLKASGELDEEFARQMLFGACDDPLEAEAVFESSWTAGLEKPWSVAVPKFNPEGETLDAVGVAKRFVRKHGKELRFVTDMNLWLVWDGTRWRPDVKFGKVQELAKQTVIGMHDEAAEALKTGDFGRHKALVGLIKQMSMRLALIPQTAASDPAVAVGSDQLDSNPYLLNCPNGTVDLRTGELWPHNPKSLITKVTAVPYIEGATGEWNRFLNEVQPDSEMQGYLRRLMGYTLIGGVTEHRMPFLEGLPRSGKSTFVEAAQAAVGDYAVTASVELFLHGGQARYEMAKLRGARLISMAEFDEHARVNVSLIKQVTGGDSVPAREIYGSPFTFKPQGTIWVSTNHMPWVGADEAAWVRIRRIPFNVSFLGREDAGLPARLAADPAVLAWIVAGALEYQQGGLKEPMSVLLATEEVKQYQDPVSRFIDEECKRVEGAETPVGTLYGQYRLWAMRGGETPMTALKFGKRLSKLGYEGRRSNGQVLRMGLECGPVNVRDIVA